MTLHVAQVWAAVPVKLLSGAKQRLAPLLTPAVREALAGAMLEDVLEVLAACGLAGLMVNTLDPQAAAIARGYGAHVVSEAADGGHTAAVAAMARILAAEGAAAMLTMPADIPAVTMTEVQDLCRARRAAPSFTIVPAHDRRGSNAVLLSPPEAVALRFGDDSFLPHLAAARGCRIDPVVIAMPGIGLDIDNPKDVAAFLAASPRGAARTRDVLRAAGLEDRPRPG